MLRFAGGGHPPALLLSHDDAGNIRLLPLDSTGPMMGTDDEAEFPSEAQAVQDGDRLFVYSDGVFEIRQADSGEMWNLEGFLDFMSRPPGHGAEKMDDLLQHVRQLQRSDEFLDDFSIVQVTW